MGDCPGVTLFQAGRNFYNVDISYLKKLCGTILGGPKLPERWVTPPLPRVDTAPAYWLVSSSTSVRV